MRTQRRFDFLVGLRPRVRCGRRMRRRTVGRNSRNWPTLWNPETSDRPQAVCELFVCLIDLPGDVTEHPHQTPRTLDGIAVEPPPLEPHPVDPSRRIMCRHMAKVHPRRAPPPLRRFSSQVFIMSPPELRLRLRRAHDHRTHAVARTTACGLSMTPIVAASRHRWHDFSRTIVAPSPLDFPTESPPPASRLSLCVHTVLFRHTRLSVHANVWAALCDTGPIVLSIPPKLFLSNLPRPSIISSSQI